MAIRVQDLPEHDRPRERLWSEGVGALADRELLAVLLRSGCNGKSAIDLAALLLAEHGGLGELAKAVPEELADVGGIGTAKAATVAAAFELARRVGRDRCSRQRIIHRPSDLAEIVLPLLGSRRREEAYTIVLDGHYRVRRLLQISLGSAEYCLLPVREVLNAVLRNDGVAFVVAHNHPSGDPTPSKHDLEITERLAEGAKTVGLQFLDHLIVADVSWTSLRQVNCLGSTGRALNTELEFSSKRAVERSRKSGSE